MTNQVKQFVKITPLFEKHGISRGRAYLISNGADPLDGEIPKANAAYRELIKELNRSIIPVRKKK